MPTAIAAMKLANIAGNPWSRNMAMMHVAMSDAVNSVQGKYVLYAAGGMPSPAASAEAAAASAGRTILLKQVPGQKSSIMEAMKSALGGVIDTATLQAMEVSEAMAAAGASKEEIEEMMQMIINKGGGISEEFLDSIKQAMAEVCFLINLLKIS